MKKFEFRKQAGEIRKKEVFRRLMSRSEREVDDIVDNVSRYLEEAGLQGVSQDVGATVDDYGIDAVENGMWVIYCSGQQLMAVLERLQDRYPTIESWISLSEAELEELVRVADKTCQEYQALKELYATLGNLQTQQIKRDLAKEREAREQLADLP